MIPIDFGRSRNPSAKILQALVSSRERWSPTGAKRRSSESTITLGRRW